jgi:hypothetical protein
MQMCLNQIVNFPRTALAGAESLDYTLALKTNAK